MQRGAGTDEALWPDTADLVARAFSGHATTLSGTAMPPAQPVAHTLMPEIALDCGCILASYD